MVNRQVPTPRHISDGGTLNVHSMFSTIQGEGPFIGCPALFIRLAGCNLQCPLCDTEYTTGAMNIRVHDICEKIDRLLIENKNVVKLIVITGGEPFRQNVVPLTANLLSRGYIVQFETNGKLPIQDQETFEKLRAKFSGRLSIVVSPKTGRLDPYIASTADAYKYVVTSRDISQIDLLPRHALANPIGGNADKIARPPRGWKGTVYVGPADHKDKAINRENMAAAVDSVKSRPGRRLYVQMHKEAYLP